MTDRAHKDALPAGRHPLHAIAESFGDNTERDAHVYVDADLGKCVRVLSPAAFYLIVSVVAGDATFERLDAYTLLAGSIVTQGIALGSLDSRADALESDVSDLQSDVSDLQSDKADKSITLTAGTGLTGGGDLSTNRSFAADFGSASGKVCQGNDARLPVSGEKDALAGTSGTPSSSNKYVTDADSRIFTAAYYTGRVTAANGTGNWSSTSYAAAIGASQPITTWTDVLGTGISRSNSVFTFTDAGKYVFHANLPINATSIYISVRLNGNSGGILFEHTDFHGADAVGEGLRPITCIITVAAGEAVTLEYAASAAGGGSYGAPPTIGGSSVSMGNIAIYRIA